MTATIANYTFLVTRWQTLARQTEHAYREVAQARAKLSPEELTEVRAVLRGLRGAKLPGGLKGKGKDSDTAARHTCADGIDTPGERCGDCAYLG